MNVPNAPKHARDMHQVVLRALGDARQFRRAFPDAQLEADYEALARAMAAGEVALISSAHYAVEWRGRRPEGG